MPVGAGSIKRAAKLNAEGSKAAQPKKVDTVEAKSEVVKVKSTAKKTVKEKTVKEKTAPKQLCSDPVCHFTEELPIYLL